MIGSFGNVSFVASSSVLRTFRDMSKEYAGRYAKHDLLGKKPKLEFTGPDTRKITFSIRLDATKGVSPRREIEQLADLTENGIAEALVLGGNFLGLFVLKSVNETDKVYDNKGGLWIADVRLELEEYDDSD